MHQLDKNKRLYSIKMHGTTVKNITVSAAIRAACRGGMSDSQKPQSENRPLGLPRPRGYDNISMYLEQAGWYGLTALINVRLQ